MKIHFFTIVLDGLPWIASHYPMMRQLPFKWTWHVVEGVAAPVKCTFWCKPLKPRLSEDGTTQYLKSLTFDGRVKLYQKERWEGKIEMVNAPLREIKEECLLWQIDSDEIWTAEQVGRVRQMFLQQPNKTSALFFCRYFMGPDIVTVGANSYGNTGEHEWRRVWRINPGEIFTTHEPPVIGGRKERDFPRTETAEAGLIFDHFAYALEKTLAFKQQYYGANSGWYKNALADWRRLQTNESWPVKRLKDFIPWVDEKAGAIKI